MKRTKSINLDRMRKVADRFRVKPIALGISAATLVLSCSSGRGVNEGEIFADLAACKAQYPQLAQECENAYQQALRVAEESGPKYASRSDCEIDFGARQCMNYRHGGNDWFMPAMAGFLFAQLLDSDRHYRAVPLYTSYSSHSPYYYRWSTVDGYSYGNYRYGRVKVHRDTFKPKPKVTKTIKRGGFGSRVAAKSKWGGSGGSKWGSKGSGSRSGWGG